MLERSPLDSLPGIDEINADGDRYDAEKREELELYNQAPEPRFKRRKVIFLWEALSYLFDDLFQVIVVDNDDVAVTTLSRCLTPCIHFCSVFDLTAYN